MRLSVEPATRKLKHCTVRRAKAKAKPLHPVTHTMLIRMMLVKAIQHHVAPTTALSKMITRTILPATGVTT